MKTLTRRENLLEPDPDSPPQLNPTSPSPSPHRKTLDLVWAQTSKGQPWWPALVLANRDDSLLHVSRFGYGHVDTYCCHVSQVKPFFNPKTTHMARHSQASLSSYKEALRFASQYLQSQLTCHCVPLEAKPLDPGRKFEIGTCNFTSLEFIHRIRDAALCVWSVDLEDSVRLKSWVFALGHGLSNGEVGFNQRKLTGDLVDKFDLDLDACADDNEEKSFDECSMGLEQNLTNSDVKGVNNARKKKRASESDKGLEREFSGTGAILNDEEAGSGKRERKKSKYLSPPYADIVGLTIHKQSEEMPDERSIGEEDDGGVEKIDIVDFEAFQAREIFNDFLLTGMDPLYLKWKRSAKVLRFFFDKYRENIFVEGREHKNYKNQKCKCQLKGKVKIEANLDDGLGLSFKSCLTPKMDRSDLMTVCDVSRVDKELESEKGKVKSDNGVHQPKKRGRPRKEHKCLSSSGSNMPNVAKSEQKKERKDLTGSVSNVPFKTNNNIGGGTVLNFAKGSYEFLEAARAQMLKTSSVENGNKLAGIGKQSQLQEQGSLKNYKNGNSDSTSGTVSKQRGRKPKIAQAHYPNPAALLLDFSKPNAANGTDTDMGMNLPSRDQLLSTFSKFGLLVEAQSDVNRDVHTARVVFARSADAEAACNSSDKLGLFGPPFASCRLHYLPPISINPSSPPQQAPAQQLSAKPQLSCIRKNLEIMISSLTGGSGLPVNGESGSALDGIRPEVRGSLVDEMQGLLMKVEKRLGDNGASSSATVPGVTPP